MEINLDTWSKRINSFILHFPYILMILWIPLMAEPITMARVAESIKEVGKEIEVKVFYLYEEPSEIAEENRAFAYYASRNKKSLLGSKTLFVRVDSLKEKVGEELFTTVEKHHINHKDYITYKDALLTLRKNTRYDLATVVPASVGSGKMVYWFPNLQLGSLSASILREGAFLRTAESVEKNLEKAKFYLVDTKEFYYDINHRDGTVGLEKELAYRILANLLYRLTLALLIYQIMKAILKWVENERGAIVE